MTSIHDKTDEQGYAGEPQREQQQRSPEETQAPFQAIADERTEHAARGIRIALTVKCRLASPQLVTSVNRNPRARKASVAREGASALRAILIQEPAGKPDHDREQKRRRAEQQNEETRDMSAQRTDHVRNRPRLACRRE